MAGANGGEVSISVRLDDSNVGKDSKRVSDRITSELSRLSKKSGSPQVNQMAKQAQLLLSQMANNSAKQDRLLQKPWAHVEDRIASVNRKIKLANKEMANTIQAAPGRAALKKQLYSDYQTMEKLRLKAFQDPASIQNIYSSIGKTGDYSTEIMRQYNRLRELYRQWEELIAIRDEYNNNEGDIKDNIKDSSAYKKTEEFQLMKEKQGGALADKYKNYEKSLGDESNALLGNLANMTKAGSSLMQLSSTLSKVGSSAGSASAALGALSSALPIIGAAVSGIIHVVKTAISWLDKLQEVAKQLAQVVITVVSKTLSALSSIQTALWNFNKAVVSGAVDGVKKLGNALKRTGKQSDSFSGKLKQSVKLLVKYVFGLRSFFYLYRRIRTQVTKGFNEIVKQAPELNASMSSLMTSLYQLRTSFAAAIEPLISYFIPALNQLIATLNNACVALASFFATLTGRNTIYKATVANVDYAKSLDSAGSSAGGASKQNDKYTTSIDELNVIDPNDSGSGSGSVNTALEELMKAASDFANLVKLGWLTGNMTKVGKYIGDAFAKLLDNIDWSKVKASARRIGSSLATLINGFLDGEVDGVSVGYKLGETIAEGLNTFLTGQTAFFSKLDAKAVADAILDFFDGAIAKIDWAVFRVWANTIANKFVAFFTEIFSRPETFANIGTTIGKALNILMQNLILVITNFPYAQAGTAFGQGLKALFESGITGEQVGTAIVNLLNGTITAAVNTLKELLSSDVNLGTEFVNAITTIAERLNADDFATMCTEIGELFHDIVYNALMGLAKNTDTLLSKAWDIVQGIWEGVKTYILGPEGDNESGTLGDAFVELLANAVGWINDHWSEIDAKVQEVATVFGSELSKIFDPERDTWKDLGELAGKCFNTILGGIITWLTTDNNLENLATSIKTFITTALETVDTKKINEIITLACKLVLDIINDPELWSALQDAISGINWSALAALGFSLFWLKLKLKLARLGGMISGFFSGGYSGDDIELDGSDAKVKTSTFEKVGEEAADSTVKGYAGSFSEARHSGILTDAVSNIFTDLDPVMSEKSKTSGKNIITGLGTGVTENMPTLNLQMQKAGADTCAAFDIGAQIKSPSRLMIQSGTQLIQGVVQGVTTNMPLATTAMQNLAKNMIQKFTVGGTEAFVINATKFNYIMKQAINGLILSCTENTAAAKEAVAKLAKEMIQSLSSGIFSMDVINAARFNYLMKKAIEGLVESCGTNTKLATDAISKLAKAVVKSATAEGGLKQGSAGDKAGSFFEIGQNIVQGLINGINDKKSEAIETMRELSRILAETAKIENEIGSPSKKFERYGKYIVEGLNIGLLSGTNDSANAMQSISNSLQIPSIVSGTTVPAGMSYSANKASSIASNNASDIINTSYMNNTDVVTAINNLIGVVSGLDLTVKLDNKVLESGSRDVRQRRGTSIATGGIYNYSVS